MRRNGLIQEFKRIFTKNRKRLYPLFHWKIRQRDGVLLKCWWSGVCGLWEVVHKAPPGHTWTQGQGPFSSTGVLQMSALSSAGWLIDYRHTFGKWTVRKHVFLCIIVHCPVFKKQGTNWESDGVERVKVLGMKEHIQWTCLPSAFYYGLHQSSLCKPHSYPKYIGNSSNAASWETWIPGLGSFAL